MQEGGTECTQFMGSSHLIDVAFKRAFLRAQLLRKSRFNSRIRHSGCVIVLYLLLLLGNEMLTGALMPDLGRKALGAILTLGFLGLGSEDLASRLQSRRGLLAQTCLEDGLALHFSTCKGAG